MYDQIIENIHSTAPSSAHVAEERGYETNDNRTEEEKYSSVIRGKKEKYSNVVRNEPKQRRTPGYGSNVGKSIVWYLINSSYST